MNKTRKRLMDVSPLMLQVKETNKFLGKIPKFLDRKRWTDEDRERNLATWRKIEQERRDELELQRKRIFLRTKREHQRRKLHDALRQERTMQRAERRARRLKRKRYKREHEDLVVAALMKKFDTVGQIRKACDDLEPKYIRRALKRLITAGRVIRTSPRRYKLIKVRKRLPNT